MSILLNLQDSLNKLNCARKKRRQKKKKWDFGSESDEDIKTTVIDGNTIIQDDNDVIRNNDLPSLSDSSRSPSPVLLPSNAQTIPSPTLKPKKFKPKPDPVPLELTLLKPMLLMNVSGKSVSKAARELGYSHSNIIIIHDDMQRELGKISIKNGGSASGHNGVKSVIDHLKTDAFRRLRIGIGRPHSEIDDRSHDIVANFVLSRVPPNEMEIFNNDVFPRCKDELFNASIK